MGGKFDPSGYGTGSAGDGISTPFVLVASFGRLLSSTILQLVVLFLLPDIIPDRFFVHTPDRRYVVSSRPEVSIAISGLQFRMPVKQHQRTLALQIRHEFRHTQLRRDRCAHVYMIRAYSLSIIVTCFISHSFRKFLRCLLALPHTRLFSCISV